MKKNESNKNMVWDFALRLFHFILIIFVVGLIVSAKLDVLYIHQYFGFGLLGLLFFRVIWGFIGSHYSRFKSFNLSFKESLMQFSQEYHNKSVRTPIGSFSTLFFLTILLILTVSGLFSSDDVLYDGPLLFLTPSFTSVWTNIHNIFHYILYFFIAIHLLAIFYYQLFKKNKIIQRMFDGYAKDNKIDLVSINEKPMKGILFILFSLCLPILIFIALQ
jgi:cytochrome b